MGCSCSKPSETAAATAGSKKDEVVPSGDDVDTRERESSTRSISKASDSKSEKIVDTHRSLSSTKTMLHTNSMMFTSEVMEEAKKSMRFSRTPVGMSEHVSESKVSLDFNDDSSAEELAKVCTPSKSGYDLGSEIVYATAMSKTLRIKQKLKGSEEREIAFGYKSVQGRAAGGLSTRGQGVASKPNQDSLVCFRVEGHDNIVVFGVFDGHGPFGQYAAHFCRMQLHKEIKACLDEQPMPGIEDCLNRAVQKIHSDFNRNDPVQTGVDPQVSGTTLIVALIHENSVYVANVGDSRCVQGVKNGKEKVKVTPLSDDHKPERESEARRIGKTEAVMLSEGQLRGGPKDGKTYVCRKDRVGNIVYGVLFSRSVGDLDAHTYLGIESTAEITKSSVADSGEQYLVLASDGVWDQLSNEEVIEMAVVSSDPQKASAAISDAATELWDSDRNSRRDDITTLVVKLR